MSVRRDAWSAAGLLVLAAALYGATTRIEGNPLVAIGPDFYPRILVGVLAALAVCLLLTSLSAVSRSARGTSRADPAPVDSGPGTEPVGPIRNRGLVIGIFLVFIAYAVALPWVGFRLATFAFLAVMRVVLGPVSGLRGWLGLILFAAVGTLFAWYVFEQHLMVLLPRGRWSGF